MKKILIFISVAILISGCYKEMKNAPEGEEMIKVGLSFSGEVSVSEESLTKVGESNILLGIQVYQGANPYAWGLFDTTEDISLYLNSGKDYSIVCQYIKNGKESIYHFDEGDATVKSYLLKDHDTYYKKVSGRDVLTDYWESIQDGPNLAYVGDNYHNFHLYSDGYSIPFDIIDKYDIRSYSSERWCKDYYEKTRWHYEVGYVYNDYVFSEKTHTICHVTNAFAYDSSVRINVEASNVIRNPAISEDIDRYYGESGIFTATAGIGAISLDMKHLVYGIQCNVTGVTDGTASITIKNDDNILIDKTGISSEYHSDNLLFSFSDMHSAWEYADNYTENITISMTWLRGVGVTQDLGSQVVQIKRNCMNIISVSLNSTKMNSVLGIESESADMNNENVSCTTHI